MSIPFEPAHDPQHDIRRAGWLADGTRYLITAPGDWNGTLLLYSHGPPTAREAPAFPEHLPLVQALFKRGYAIAGCGTDLFYPLEQNLPHQIEVLEMFEQVVTRPRRTIAWGESIGALMTAALAQTYGDRFAGAMPLGGPLAGGTPHWNQDLDCSFVLKTLVAPDSPLELVNIEHPGANLEVAMALLAEAQQTARGRARLSLAAAVRQIPGWCDPTAPEPSPDRADERERNQRQWLADIVLLVATSARRILEDRAGGNPSWNVGVDYGEQLRSSSEAATVALLYEGAGLDLDLDLRVLAGAPRVEADPGAVAYFTRYLAFNGDLGGVPVISVHTRGDGLCPVEHEKTYADLVRQAGNDHLLRQVYVDRAGHCSYSPAEALAALHALEERIDTGRWPELVVEDLNRQASELGSELNILPPAMVMDLQRTGRPAAPAFIEYQAGAFSRPSYLPARDVRPLGG